MARVNKASTTLVKSGAKLKQVVAALQESQGKLRQMFDSVTDAISVIDLNGVIIETNQRTVEMHGFSSKDELLGRNALELVARRDHKRIAANMRQAIKEGTVRGVEYTLLKADGSEFPGELSTSILKDASGKRVGHITIARDITERKKAEEALRESEDKYKTLAEDAPIGIYFNDFSGTFLYGNKKAEEITGYKREELLGRSFLKLKLLDPRGLGKAIKLLALNKLGKATGPDRFVLNRKDGTKSIVEIRTRITTVGGKKVVLGMVEDITERKQAQEELEESQKFSSSLLESSPNPISVINPDLSIRYVNPAFEKLSGFTLAEIAGMKAPYPWWPEGVSEKIIASLKDSMKHGGRKSGTEWNFRKKNGERFWVTAKSAPVMQEGKAVYLVINWIDVTERKQAENALRESEERYRAVIEGAHDMIQSVALDGHIIFVNRAWLDTLGYTSAELPGLNLFQIIHPDSRSHCQELFAKVINGEALHGIEASFLTKDGRRILVEGNAAPRYVGDKIVATQGIFRDITERRQMEEKLWESEDYLRTLFDAAAGGILVIEPETHKIVDANPAIIKMVGVKREQIIGRVCHKFVCPAEVGKCPITDLKQKVDTSERILLNADGGKIPILKSVVPITRHGRQYLLEWLLDITERKRMEEELKAAQEHLIRSEKLAAIGQLASGVGHELRNPLGAIKTAVQYARRKIAGSELSASEPKVLEFLGLVEEEVDSANKVITDLLSFSRVAKPTVSLVNVGSIIKGALDHVAVPGNVEVVTDADAGVPMVMVDGAQIQQVFINVILNALEAMPQGGRLEIRARGKDGFVTVEFTDTGGGIPESVMGKIFDPLFTTKPKGIGLGLAMCKSIMDRHGGDIGVRSKEGKGTTFTLSLPTRVV